MARGVVTSWVIAASRAVDRLAAPRLDVHDGVHWEFIDDYLGALLAVEEEGEEMLESPTKLGFEKWLKEQNMRVGIRDLRSLLIKSLIPTLIFPRARNSAKLITIKK